MTIMQINTRATQAYMALVRCLRVLIEGGYLPAYLQAESLAPRTWGGWYLPNKRNGQRLAINYLDIPFRDNNGNTYRLSVAMQGILEAGKGNWLDFENYPLWIITISVEPKSQAR